MNILEQIKSIKLVPVTVFESLDEVIPTLKQLEKGNVPVTEICFRTDFAEEAIKIAVNEFPNLLVGAGTVINKKQCEKAIKAGAKFIVSPGFSDDVFDVCSELNIPYLPGCLTPTEIMHAIDKGLNLVKFFPAGEFGGLKTIKALSSAFPSIKFLPTGGVNNQNLKEFVDSKMIFACGGSWVSKGTPDEITSLCLEARKIIKGE